MDILVYKKGWVIKHIKSPARVKVELPDLWKNLMRNDVEYDFFVKTKNKKKHNY